LVLGHDAASRQIQRELVIGLLGGRLKIHGVKACLAVRGSEPVQEHARCAGMVGTGARPEDAVFLENALISDAGIIRRAAGSMKRNWCVVSARV